MKDKNEILAELPNFIGTDHYYEYNPQLHKGILTDGTMYVAQTCGAFWLFDKIFAKQLDAKLQMNPFQSWKLKRQRANVFTLICTDGNGNKLAHSEIRFSDFPLDEIEIWVEKGERDVALLPSEH